jgi:GR25 family glycosyltransferase involved in LPS biosynthesis
MSVMNFFTNIYVINLDKRTDRWASIQHELRKLGVADRAIRISGVDLGGHPGCTASHKKFLDAAIANGKGVSLVIEDDASVCDNWAELLTSSLYGSSTLPGDWDILYLGYNLDPTSQGMAPPNFVGHNLIELYGCLTTHMYAVNCGDYNLDRIKRYRALMESYPAINQIDMLYLTIQSMHHYKTYAVYPMIATQSSGFSDISGFNITYKLRENVDNVLRNNNKFANRPK